MVDSWNTGFTGVYRSFSINFTLPGTGGGGGTVTWTSDPIDAGWTPPLTRKYHIPGESNSDYHILSYLNSLKRMYGSVFRHSNCNTYPFSKCRT